MGGFGVSKESQNGISIPVIHEEIDILQRSRSENLACFIP